MARGGINPDFDILHHDEVRDGQTGNYTKLIKRTKDEVIKTHKRFDDRRFKLVKRG